MGVLRIFEYINHPFFTIFALPTHVFADTNNSLYVISIDNAESTDDFVSASEGLSPAGLYTTSETSCKSNAFRKTVTLINRRFLEIELIPTVLA